jgi:hypothetical protein
VNPHPHPHPEKTICFYVLGKAVKHSVMFF